MKKLLGILSGLLITGGTAMTVVACGLRVDVDENYDISKIKINNIKVGDSEQSVLNKIQEAIRSLYLWAENKVDYRIEGLELLLTKQIITKQGSISVVGIGKFLQGGVIIEISDTGSTTKPIHPSPIDPPATEKISIAGIQIKNIHRLTSLEVVKQKVHKNITARAKGAVLGIDYNIAGHPQHDQEITIQATETSKWIKDEFTIQVQAEPSHNLSDIEIDNVKVGDTKESVLVKIQEAVREYYDQAQIDLDYTVKGLDALVENNHIKAAGSVHIQAQGKNLTGGFILWIRDSGSTTEPIDPANPTQPIKLIDISIMTVTGVDSLTTLAQVREKVAEAMVAHQAGDALLGRDYIIQGTPQDDNQIIVRATHESKIITNAFTINVEQHLAQDISNTEINDIRINDSEESVSAKIKKAIRKYYPQAQNNIDYTVTGLDRLVENHQVVHEGSINIQARGQRLTGGFTLWIRDSGSTTTPIDPNNPNPPVKLFDISTISVTGVDNLTTLKALEAKVATAIENEVPGAVLKTDYMIEGTPQQNQRITVRATKDSKLIKNFFTIQVKNYVKQDISEIEITNIQLQDSKSTVLDKIQKAIRKYYAQAQINLDYTVKGLDQLLQNGLLAHPGSIHVEAEGERLSGGFVLWVRDSGSTTNPIDPNPNPPIRLFDLSQIVINGINKFTPMNEVKQKVQTEIQRKAPDASWSKDYQIQGDPQKDKKIIVSATENSRWLYNSFTILVEQDEKLDISDIQIHNVKVGDAKKSVLNKIQNQIRKFYAEAVLDTDYVINGLSALTESGENIVHQGSINIKAKGTNLTGGFALWIRDSGSTSEPIGSEERPIKLKNLASLQNKITDVNHLTTMDELEVKVEKEIIKIADGAILGDDYTIIGTPQNSQKIIVQATEHSRWLYNSFTIDMKQYQKANISNIYISNVQVGDAKKSVLNKIQNKIREIYSGATLDRDYQIIGLNELVHSGVVVSPGSVNIIAKGDYLTGGFALWIRDSGSTTNPIDPTNPTPPVKLMDISDVYIANVNNETSMDDLKRRVHQAINQKAVGVVEDIDYTIEGTPQTTNQIKVKATSTSKLIQNSFAIEVMQVKFDISNIVFPKIPSSTPMASLIQMVYIYISRLAHGIQLGRDFIVSGEIEPGSILFVDALPGSQLIKGFFTIFVYDDIPDPNPPIDPNPPTNPNDGTLVSLKNDLQKLLNSIPWTNNITYFVQRLHEEMRKNPKFNNIEVYASSGIDPYNRGFGFWKNVPGNKEPHLYLIWGNPVQ
ncbi:hypothetical protein [Williamsoniiplasma lucivorax]|uniref:Lipoprotein n=1 Tax=Williamsoniiplasma lucivorax TaxID=209274 RepID=A0A2S5RD59_9MOLU|nr:hypothetical protein [Williamsoniiplasma lucivorax]PPE05142.1 hypothetical protein ELUCI_v1c06780 [Williamsoniiplasma lucivorax]